MLDIAIMTLRQTCRYGCLSLWVVVAFSCGPVAALAASDSRRQLDDRPIICAGYYRHLAQFSSEKHDKVQADAYMARFRALYDRGIADMMENGSTREQAHDMIQGYSDLLGALAIKEDPSLKYVIRMCAREFPVPAIWK